MRLFEGFFGNGRPKVTVMGALDLVTTVASFTSDPKDIDPLLDKVRTISMQLPSGGTLSRDDEASLLNLYLIIEHYLITSDPIRIFTREELRSKVNMELLARLEVQEAKKSKV